MPNPDLIDSLDPLPAPTSTPAPRKRKRRWLRAVLWTIAGLAALVLLAAGIGVLRLRSAANAALPQLDGEIHIAGLSAPVTIQRDTHGVPHISAATEDDLFVAQGYVTAQDRLWQKDLLRRNANGELAEILGFVGTPVIRHDKMERVFQIRNTARRIYSNLPPADRARVDDYARGVNLFIAQHQDSLPPEFRLLFYKPQPWSGADSISIGLMMVQTLDTHWNVKLAREEISADLHNPKLESDLYPVGSWRDHPPTGVQIDLSQPHAVPPPTEDTDEEDEPTKAAVGGDGLAGSALAAGNAGPSTALRSAQDDSIMERRFAQDDSMFGGTAAHEDLRGLRDLLGLPACAGCASGSNNWVIAGKHTASGQPLLSNDMHLDLSVPNIWYMADLRAPGFHAAGVTLPGMPFVIAGHNEHVAWGFTALMGDVQDLYYEKLDGKGNYQAADTTWKPLAIEHEVIHVRGGKDVTLDVQSTEHGPLMNPLFTREMRPFTLKWTLYDPTLNALP